MRVARLWIFAVMVVVVLAACHQLFSIHDGDAVSSGADSGSDALLGDAPSDSAAPPADGSGLDSAVDAGCGATCVVDVSANRQHT